MLTKLLERLAQNRRRLVFPEGHDHRILEAAVRLKKDDLLTPVLLGSEQEIYAAAKKEGFDISGIEIIDPATYEGFEDMVAELVELRKGKMDADACRAALSKTNYFGTMLIKMGLADAMLGGALYATADIVRPALQIVKTAPGSKIVSSCFILNKTLLDGRSERYAMADCAINLYPTSEELVDIALQTAETAKMFGIEPKMALLSFSTLGSGSHESVDKVRAAADALKAMNLPYPVEGELQFDTAVSAVVAKTKAPNSDVAGQANCFIFPNIDAGNIGYKIAQRLGGFDAYGPILQGLAAPINDLSRGCTADEVYMMAIITAGSKV